MVRDTDGRSDAFRAANTQGFARLAVCQADTVIKAFSALGRKRQLFIIADYNSEVINLSFN